MRKLTVIISSFVLFYFESCSGETIRFEDIVKDYVACVEDSFGLNATWWSLSAKGPFFEANKRFKRFQIRVYENQTFDTLPKVAVEEEIEELFPDEVYINDGPTPVNISLSQVNDLHESESFHVRNNMKFSSDVKAEGKVSFLSGSISGGYQKENKGSKMTSNSITKRIISMRQYIINPYSEVKGTSLLVRRKIIQSTTHEMLIEGYLVIAFSNYIKPKVPNNYEAIKNILEENSDAWETCGSGLDPEIEKRGVFALPIEVLADDVDLLEKNDNMLYYHVTEVHETIEEKSRFRLIGRKLKDKQQEVFDKVCK